MFWRAEGGGVLGASTAQKGGLRCGSNSKKGGFRCGSGPKRGVCTAAHTYAEHVCEYPPPPGHILYCITNWNLVFFYD